MAQLNEKKERGETMKLAEWSTHPVHLRYAREIHWPSADEDGADYVVLRLVTEDGMVGVAEGGAKLVWNSVNPRALSVIIEELFIPLIRDIDLLDETRRHSRGRQSPRAPHGPVNGRVCLLGPEGAGARRADVEDLGWRSRRTCIVDGNAPTTDFDG